MRTGMKENGRQTPCLPQNMDHIQQLINREWILFESDLSIKRAATISEIHQLKKMVTR